MYYLYAAHGSMPGGDDSVNEAVLSPTSLFVSGEKKSFRLFLGRLYFWLISAGKFRIVYILDEIGEIAHISYVVPKCYKFPFMDKQDYEIGPCWTKEEYRGRGLYGRALGHIIGKFGGEDTHFYMIVHEGNKSSMRGVEKAGFEICGYVKKTKWLKRYIWAGEKK